MDTTTLARELLEALENAVETLENYDAAETEAIEEEIRIGSAMAEKARTYL